MKINKKGFTLVELLAVVVILLAISVIAVSSISAAIERNKAKQNDAKKELIVSYGKLYYDEHKNEYSSITNFCVTTDKLKTAKYISADELMDSDNNEITGAVKYTGTKFEFVARC